MGYTNGEGVLARFYGLCFLKLKFEMEIYSLKSLSSTRWIKTKPIEIGGLFGRKRQSKVTSLRHKVDNAVSS